MSIFLLSHNLSGRSAGDISQRTQGFLNVKGNTKHYETTTILLSPYRHLKYPWLIIPMDLNNYIYTLKGLKKI